MPSIRKRIGYLPLPGIQELIIEIANNENLSQSKVVGKLVEEALSARGLLKPQQAKHFNHQSWLKNRVDNGIPFLKKDDVHELISDKGITYNRKGYKVHGKSNEDNLLNSKQQHNLDLIEQFKQFLIYQKDELE